MRIIGSAEPLNGGIRLINILSFLNFILPTEGSHVFKDDAALLGLLQLNNELKIGWKSKHKKVQIV